jgi:hypothetical protein
MMTVCLIQGETAMDELNPTQTSTEKSSKSEEYRLIKNIVDETVLNVCNLPGVDDNGRPNQLDRFQLVDVLITVAQLYDWRRVLEQSNVPGDIARHRLTQIYLDRRIRIRDTPLDYLRKRNSPINSMLEVIAGIFSEGNANGFLFPTVEPGSKNVFLETLNDVKLGELMISDDGKKFINVRDLLKDKFYQKIKRGEPIVLEYLMLTNDGSKAYKFTPNEINILKHWTPSLPDIFDRVEGLKIPDFSSLHGVLRWLSTEVWKASIYGEGSEKDAGKTIYVALVQLRVLFDNNLTREQLERLFNLELPYENFKKQVVDRLFRAADGNYDGLPIKYCLQCIASNIDMTIDSYEQLLADMKLSGDFEEQTLKTGDRIKLVQDFEEKVFRELDDIQNGYDIPSLRFADDVLEQKAEQAWQEFFMVKKPRLETKRTVSQYRLPTSNIKGAAQNKKASAAQLSSKHKDKNNRGSFINKMKKSLRSSKRKTSRSLSTLEASTVTTTASLPSSASLPTRLTSSSGASLPASPFFEVRQPETPNSVDDSSRLTRTHQRDHTRRGGMMMECSPLNSKRGRNIATLPLLKGDEPHEEHDVDMGTSSGNRHSNYTSQSDDSPIPIKHKEHAQMGIESEEIQFTNEFFYKGENGDRKMSALFNFIKESYLDCSYPEKFRSQLFDILLSISRELTEFTRRDKIAKNNFSEAVFERLLYITELSTAKQELPKQCYKKFMLHLIQLNSRFQCDNSTVGIVNFEIMQGTIEALIANKARLTELANKKHHILQKLYTVNNSLASNNNPENRSELIETRNQLQQELDGVMSYKEQRDLERMSFYDENNLRELVCIYEKDKKMSIEDNLEGRIKPDESPSKQSSHSSNSHQQKRMGRK